MQVASRTHALILNVNDNEVARYLTTAMLQRASFNVIEAGTGREALLRVEEHRPDLVVLDVQLPDMSGLEVCRLVRKDPNIASTKILHTSATFISTDNKVRALRGGADAYLTQPFEAEELVATIDALLRLTRTEEELRAIAEQLREEDRRKNEFLAMLAHELRNPLAAIWAALPLLERRPPQDEEEHRALSVLSRQSGQLKRLIDDLLDVARVTQGKIELRTEVVDLSRLLITVMDNVRRTSAAQRKQHLHADLPQAPLAVLGDPVRLEQVFANLLDNASKYTPEGGQIWVCARATKSAEVCVEVRDDGAGMTKETLPQVFSLFAQADVTIARSRGGLGIGLTLVRRLVELHGGQVSAYSDGLGHGSTFRVQLPLADVQHLAEPARPSPSAGHHVDVPRRVLVIDDNEDLQTLIAGHLRSWGHEVACASDGAEGLAKLLQFKPQVALIDIGLPGLDGFQVAERAGKSLDGQRPRMIAVTGYSSPHKRAMALECGFDEVIVKPVEPAQLRAVLRSLP